MNSLPSKNVLVDVKASTRSELSEAQYVSQQLNQRPSADKSAFVIKPMLFHTNNVLHLLRGGFDVYKSDCASFKNHYMVADPGVDVKGDADRYNKLQLQPDGVTIVALRPIDG